MLAVLAVLLAALPQGRVEVLHQHQLTQEQNLEAEPPEIPLSVAVAAQEALLITLAQVQQEVMVAHQEAVAVAAVAVQLPEVLAVLALEVS